METAHAISSENDVAKAREVLDRLTGGAEPIGDVRYVGECGTDGQLQRIDGSGWFAFEADFEDGTQAAAQARDAEQKDAYRARASAMNASTSSSA